MKKILLLCLLSLTVSCAYANDVYGVFRVSDESGYALGDVEVSCCINNGPFKDCGFSKDHFTVLGGGYHHKGKEVNFIQYQCVFPKTGDRVVWRFRKRGYSVKTVSVVVPDQHKIECFKRVQLRPMDKRKNRNSRDDNSGNSNVRTRVLDIPMREANTDYELRWPNGEVAFRGGVCPNYQGRQGTGVYLFAYVFEKGGKMIDSDKWRLRNSNSRYERNFGAVTVKAYIMGDFRTGVCRITVILRD